MSLFDFTFGLSAVILGLALAEMASRLQQLIFAGRRVRWAPEPILLTALVFLVIVVVWLGQWRQHGVRETTIGEVVLQILAVLGPFMVSAAVLPRPPEEGSIDLHHYYDQSRRFIFGVLILGQLLNWTFEFLIVRPNAIHGAGAEIRAILLSLPYYTLGPHAALMFIRWRWFNIAALLFVLGAFGYAVHGMRLTG